MEYHEYANLFPMLPDAELQELANDIKAHGLQVPVTTYQGKILDGRNRWRACQIAGVEPSMTEYTGDDPLAFVVSGNLIRRHLDESQRGMVAAKLANLPEGRPGKTTPPIGGVSQDAAAKMLNVGARTAERASRVVKAGTPELQAAVEAGEVNLNQAEQLAKLPAARQLEVLAEGPEAVKEKAKEIRDFGGEIAPAPKPDGEYTTPETTEAPAKPVKYAMDDAARLWAIAKVTLDKILKNDQSRIRILKEVIEYAQGRITARR
jgi:ParB-like chromosome segregation protein Spo0J